ncbi:NifB/NifX family molybdenum-iron cluster-binding protein [Lutibacter citreus]|uniref:NifB/NifX family molybdenum-iron cluster-binding protein n=1 Tax=Lutibacter citreus TaxID=2138210 RepID=UPI000DBE7C7C|nr:NifB/NifX family molybdenum-iron cluster-binding protein [Lutibacter citreus]
MKKIAIPVNENKEIEDHFGQCDFYEIYTIVEGNKIQEVNILESEQGCGCKSNIASVLAENGVTTMLAGGIGQGAINVLNQSNIDVIRGCSGKTKSIVEQYLNGKILDSGETCTSHSHDHECSH